MASKKSSELTPETATAEFAAAQSALEAAKRELARDPATWQAVENARRDVSVAESRLQAAQAKADADAIAAAERDRAAKAAEFAELREHLTRQATLGSVSPIVDRVMAVPSQLRADVQEAYALDLTHQVAFDTAQQLASELGEPPLPAQPRPSQLAWAQLQICMAEAGIPSGDRSPHWIRAADGPQKVLLSVAESLGVARSTQFDAAIYPHLEEARDVVRGVQSEKVALLEAERRTAAELALAERASKPRGRVVNVTASGADMPPDVGLPPNAA